MRPPVLLTEILPENGALVKTSHAALHYGMSNNTDFAIYAEDPQPQKPRGGQPKWAKRVEELRRLPHHHWYVIGKFANRTTASSIRSALTRRHQDIEFKYTTNRPENTSKLYARVKEAAK